MVDSDRAEAGRTIHLCPLFESRSDSVVLAVATFGRCCLVHRRLMGPVCATRAVRLRLGPRPRLNTPAQSLRSVRAAPSVAELVGPAVHDAAVRDSRTIPARSASTLRW